MRTTLFSFATDPSRRRRWMLATVGVSVLFLAAACGGDEPSPSDHGGAHSAGPLASPTGATPSTGAAGAHHAAAGNGLLSTVDGYTLKPSTTSLTVGEQTIHFRILDPRGMPQTEYVQDQTKRMHFYLVRLDLTGYQHLHPTLSTGTWSIKVNVAAPGPYRMYTDFIAKDSSNVEHPLVLSTVLTAPGTYTPETLPAASNTTTAAGLTASLSGVITSGTKSTVSFRITADNKPVTDLEPYLDSYAHLTAIHVGDLAYRHVHPELSAKPGEKGGPTLPFSVDLPAAGAWRLFLQVQRAGTLHLLPLTVTAS